MTNKNTNYGFILGLSYSRRVTDWAELERLSLFKHTKEYKGLELASLITGELMTINTWDEFVTHGLNEKTKTIDEKHKAT